LSICSGERQTWRDMLVPVGVSSWQTMPEPDPVSDVVASCGVGPWAELAAHAVRTITMAASVRRMARIVLHSVERGDDGGGHGYDRVSANLWGSMSSTRASKAVCCFRSTAALDSLRQRQL
jgi:hypothetical protein